MRASDVLTPDLAYSRLVMNCRYSLENILANRIAELRRPTVTHRIRGRRCQSKLSRPVNCEIGPHQPDGTIVILG